MRITKSQTVITAVIIAVLSYVAYGHIIFKDSAIATQHIEAKIQKSQQKNNNENIQYFGEKRAQIALGEFNKNVIESERGCNCGPEIDKYNQGTPTQWCTTFASWVANEAGNPIIDQKTGLWKITNSHVFTDHLKQYGTFYTREEVINNNIEPKLGDFVIFYRGNYEDKLGHVDIVVGEGKDGRADLVGGNIRDRITYKKDFPFRDYYGFLGIGRPEK